MSEISRLMSTDVVTVSPDTTILGAAKVLVKQNITGLPVVDKENRLLGIVSEKDLLILAYSLATKSYASNDSPKTVEEVMAKDVVTFDKDDPVDDVIECLMDGNFRRVPILSGDKLVGIVSRKDLLTCDLLV
jgi:acetoin utilization protein AcuB